MKPSLFSVKNVHGKSNGYIRKAEVGVAPKASQAAHADEDGDLPFRLSEAWSSLASPARRQAVLRRLTLVFLAQQSNPLVNMERPS